MKKEKQSDAVRLREQGMSVGNIAGALQVSKSSVSNWVRDVKLSDDVAKRLIENSRNAGCKTLGSIREHRRQAREKAFQDGFDGVDVSDPLMVSAVMLYEAEGRKSDYVSFVNTEPNLVLIFREFLKRLQVADSKMVVRCTIHSEYEFMKKEIEDVWLAQLKLPQTCLRKTLVIEGGTGKKNKHLIGMCRIDVYNILLLQYLFGMGRRIKSELLGAITN